MELKEELKMLAKKINVEISDEQADLFLKYMDLLLEWNEKINLTAITEKDEIILKHFIDSLTIIDKIPEDANVLDLGTGAGFPGIPIAIIKKEAKILLVDSLNKRINFLNIVKGELDLKNVETLHSRAEEIGKNKLYREGFDIVVSRAVANLTVLSEYIIPLIKIGGKGICMKGPNIDQELTDSKYAIEVLGGVISKIEECCLPDSDIRRNIICINKKEHTPNKYPRKAGQPVKDPLIK